MQRYEPQGPWAKRHFADGRAQGREEGREEGHADSVLILLRARGIAVSEEIGARIVACRDLPTIERWLLRAATVTSASDIFVD